jgi:DNA-binding FadR family transcriptional regulator
MSEPMEPTLVRQEPLARQVADQFRRNISSGEWPVGSKIPGENELSRRSGVSRGTIREALRALSMAGLLEPRVGDGTYVRSRDQLGALLSREIDERSLRHALDVRGILETAASSRAAINASSANIEELRVALQNRNDAAAALDVPAYVDADANFHRSVVKASGNPLLLRLYEAIGETITTSIAQTTRLPESDSLRQLHIELVEAIQTRDESRARDLSAQMNDAVTTELA